MNASLSQRPIILTTDIRELLCCVWRHVLVPSTVYSSSFHQKETPFLSSPPSGCLVPLRQPAVACIGAMTSDPEECRAIFALQSAPQALDFDARSNTSDVLPTLSTLPF